MDEIAKNWGNLREKVQAVDPPLSHESALWTQGRVQMLALKDRAAKRAEAAQEKVREREAGFQMMRKEVEDRRKSLLQESRSQREEDQKLEEQRRADARRREREQRETMAPTVKFEEVWEIN